ncbi:hypothetical protein [Streptomyces sp. SID13031]|uniref:hypothetical protein n=1 Tax=Streptomyces sp. SID13031 TaxID=2706046 RepID=UPI0013CD2990|nr:hypothetical protein [Streptomyces sp. SID13031]NEA35049.1 hypothetical protein [Streptomyces sp. SID13031]
MNSLPDLPTEPLPDPVPPPMAEAAPEVVPPLEAVPWREAGEDSAARYPDLYQAATNGPATFRHLVQAHQLAASTDQLACDAGNWLIPALSQKFSEAHGGIEKEYYCSEVVGGCLLAKDRAVYSILNSPPPELVDAEISCKVVAKEALYGLQGKGVVQQLEEATDHAYSGLTRVMVAADLVAGGGTPEQIEAAIEAAKNEVAVVKARVEVLLQRQARLEYFQGVLGGIVPTFVLVILFGVAAEAWWRSSLVPGALVAAIAMSALGATISVIQRMSKGSLVIDHSASRWQRTMLGAFRPGVGAIFGCLAYFTLLTGILAGGSTVGSPASVAVFGLTGFAAGFSERFATDMLDQASKLIAK